MPVLPPRRGPPPRTNPAMPHAQLDQTAPLAMQEELFRRAAALPGVRVAPSRVSVPGARAFHLDEALAEGPDEAFMVGREFAHLHPARDGSLHMMLPVEWVREAERAGWAEPHPLARAGVMVPNAVMVFGPRDEEEIETVWRLVRVSHAFARGERVDEDALGANRAP